MGWSFPEDFKFTQKLYHYFHNDPDLKILDKWKYESILKPQYKEAIKVWTERDPYKRQVAKDNNLNWVEVFSIKLNDVINNFINTISKLNN